MKQHWVLSRRSMNCSTGSSATAAWGPSTPTSATDGHRGLATADAQTWPPIQSRRFVSIMTINTADKPSSGDNATVRADGNVMPQLFSGDLPGTVIESSRLHHPFGKF